MSERVEVLDHGYVSLVESWGSDERVIESARMSTQRGFEGWGPKCPVCGTQTEDRDLSPCPKCGPIGRQRIPGDEKLLAYLWKMGHATPFEMGGATFEIQAPIFVFREWHRHRTQSYSEMSARYAPLPEWCYVPTLDRVMRNAGGTNKQAGRADDAEVLTEENAKVWLDWLQRLYDEAESFYRFGLKIGVPKELARIGMPVGHYTRMRASANLRNWLAFLTLRDHKAAQWEIQQFAGPGVRSFLEKVFPRTLALYAEGS